MHTIYQHHGSCFVLLKFQCCIFNRRDCDLSDSFEKEPLENILEVVWKMIKLSFLKINSWLIGIWTTLQKQLAVSTLLFSALSYILTGQHFFGDLGISFLIGTIFEVTTWEFEWLAHFSLIFDGNTSCQFSASLLREVSF